MPEIGTSGSMSGDGKRGVGHWPQATAPILDSAKTDLETSAIWAAFGGKSGRQPSDSDPVAIYEDTPLRFLNPTPLGSGVVIVNRARR